MEEQEPYVSGPPRDTKVIIEVKTEDGSVSLER